MAQPVSDVGSNREDNIASAAKVIGRSAHRRAVFSAIYTGKKKFKTVLDLCQLTGLSRIRVLDAGKKLATHHLVVQKRLGGVTAYEKIDFFHANKKRILTLASSPAKLKDFPTKVNPMARTRIVTVRLAGQRARIEHITIDDIGAFRRVRSASAPVSELGNKLSEEQFKHGLQMVIGEGGKFRDWGGEVADLFTTRVTIGGRRFPAAWALKGPAMKGKLVPGKMGKNGDQIQRLFEAPAQVFLVQYCRQIELTVLSQMEQLATVRSLMTGNKIFYGIIDGQDSRRIVDAYPRQFRTGNKRKRTRS